MHDKPLKLDEILTPEVYALFSASTARSPDFYQVIGLFLVNYCHVEYALDWLTAKMLRIDNLELFNEAVTRGTAAKIKLMKSDPRFGANFLARASMSSAAWTPCGTISPTRCRAIVKTIAFSAAGFIGSGTAMMT